MGAFDPEVFNAVFEGVEGLIPVRVDDHPLGCHRQRAANRDCFQVMLVRLVTGCSWEDAEFLCGNVVSDTTARARRDEWVDAGVFDAISHQAIEGYDRIVGLDFSDVSLDGCTRARAALQEPARRGDLVAQEARRSRASQCEPHRSPVLL